MNHKPYENVSFDICWQWLRDGRVTLHVEKYGSVLGVFLDWMCVIVILSVCSNFWGFYSILFLLSCTWTATNVKFIKR